MARRQALSTAQGNQWYVGTEIRDSISALDVLYANQFEEMSFDSQHLEQTEENFYRGAPPKWLNFHISDQAEPNGTGTYIVERDECSVLVQEIQRRRNHPGTSVIKLYHEPGSGGTTVAMQVLWKLRKTFRCAALKDSTPGIESIAEEVVCLYTAGGRGRQNTVLLLLDEEPMSESLPDSIMTTASEQDIVPRTPVVIVLSCVRKAAVLQSDHFGLKRALSDTEKQRFSERNEWLRRRFGEKTKEFHGFNIMQTDFSQAYVEQACNVFSTVKRANKPPKTQLAAFLSLLNAYVPGSYLLESQCRDILKHNNFVQGPFSLKDKVQPFSHLIITFRQNETSDSRVCMAHPMIAQHCVELMAEAGVTRSDTARNLLTRLCREEVPPCFLGFVKDMLTKREMKRREDPTGNQEIKEERFSRLILDIQNEEDSRQSASVLKVASKKFYQNPFFPQALARVYYIELKKYVVAEKWAEEAKKRAPQNSFVADTLGQIHKNHLKNIAYRAKTRDILRLAKKAIEAFRHEEQLAENDLEPDMRGDGKTKVSHVFNTRGQFGYVQVCNLLYDLLVRQNETWARILTRNVSMGSALQSLGDNKLYRYNDLIKSLRDDIERKCEFFDKYLTYSKPDMNRNDATYISTDTSDCYRKYVGHAKGKCQSHIQRLKQKQAGTSAALVSCLGRENIELDLKEITTWWKKICSREPSSTALVNYFLAHITLLNKGGNFPSNGRYFTLLSEKMPLSRTEEPELHMLALLLHWPTDSGNSVHDLSQLVDNLNFSYEWAFKSYFRSRYLCPLFFIGKGQGLRRIVHTKVVQDEAVQDWRQWGDERIFQHPNVQERLLRVEGVVRAYRVYATIGGTEIEVNANLRNSLWRPRQVTFYLGFTIKGPVAFDLQTETEGFNQHNAELAQL